MSRSRVWQLAFRHESLRGNAKVLGMAAVTGTFVVNVLSFRASEIGDSYTVGRFDAFLAEAVLLAGFAAILIRSASGRRSRPWEAALPIHSHELWRSHHLALTLAGLGSLLVTGGVMAGLLLLMQGMLDLPLLTDPRLVIAPVRPLLFVLAASGLVALRRPDLTDLADDGRWPKLRIGLVVLMYALLLLFQFVRPFYALAPVLLVMAALLRARDRLPSVLETWPGGAAAAAGRAESRAELSTGRATGSVVTRIVMRQLFKWPMNWVIMPPFLLGGGLLLAGFLPFHPEAGFDDQSMRLMNFWIVVYMLLAILGHFVENLWRVDHLPLSRRRLLLWAVLPNVLALLLGYAVGIGILERQKSLHDEIELLANRDHLWLDMPLEFFDLTWSESPPAVDTPDGQPLESYSRRLLPGTPLTVHNTYHLPAGADARFVAWQISRAVDAVYGATIEPQEIRARYLKTDPEGRVAPVEGGLTLRADYPELEPSYRGPVFPLLIGSLLTAYLLIVAGLFSVVRSGLTLVRWRIWFWGSMVLLLALHVGGFGSLIAEWTTEWAMSAVVLVSARAIRDVGPVAVVLTWAVAAAAVAGAWSFALARFRAAEAPRAR